MVLTVVLKDRRAYRDQQDVGGSETIDGQLAKQDREVSQGKYPSSVRTIRLSTYGNSQRSQNPACSKLSFQKAQASLPT